MFTRVAVVLRGFVRDLHVSLNPSERADVTVGLTVGVRVCVCVVVCVCVCGCVRVRVCFWGMRGRNCTSR